MEDREMPQMHKDGESKMTRIMMATVQHMTSCLGVRLSGRLIFVEQGGYKPTNAHFYYKIRRPAFNVTVNTLSCILQSIKSGWRNQRIPISDNIYVLGPLFPVHVLLSQITLLVPFIQPRS